MIFTEVRNEVKNEMRMHVRVKIFKCCSVCSIRNELKNYLKVYHIVNHLKWVTVFNFYDNNESIDFVHGKSIFFTEVLEEIRLFIDKKCFLAKKKFRWSAVWNLFFFKGRKKDFWKGYGVFLRIIGPLAEAI
jgi:hypothetical protein